MIFYFSATGNSKWAAEKIASLVADKICDITTMGDHPEYSLKAGEKVGFVFPVHGWRVPRIVSEFLKRLTLSNYNQSTYTYALCTAGDSVGETMALLAAQITERGMHLNASFSIIMPESYIGLPFMYLDTFTSANTKYYNASVKMGKYARLISESRGGEHLDKGAFPKLYSGLLGGFFTKYLITDACFHVDKKKCIGCGICEKVCPVHDVECQKDKKDSVTIEASAGEKKGLPEWKHNGKCLTCFACLHHCPKNAISWGWFTKGKGQYYYGKKNVKQCL